MKVTIEIEEDSKLIEALAAEIAKTESQTSSGAATDDSVSPKFELTRPTSALTCVAFSCGVS